jgi:hypothetical protein
MYPPSGAQSGQSSVSLNLPPEPQTDAEHVAAEAVNEVVGRWFSGGEEGWPHLSGIERRLIAMEVVAALRAGGVRLQLSTAREPQEQRPRDC